MRVIFRIIGIVLLLFVIIWYFFVKQDDYIVKFKVNTIPSVVFNTVNNWEETLNNVTKQKVETEREVLFSKITQKIVHKDSTYVFNWEFEPINDSITSVRVGISEKRHSLKNRLLIPFGLAPIKKYALNTVSLFAHGVENNLKEYKVKIDSQQNESPAAYCACVSATATQKNKAMVMLGINAKVMSFLYANNIKFLGTPMLQLTNWDIKNEQISFNFCFPIEKQAIMPQEKGIFYKEIKPFPSIKATFNGNYKISDRAWYHLINYAEKLKINHNNNMLEVFYNDPQQGGDELKWKAEIFMPVLPN